MELRTHILACGYDWINDEFLCFIILQSLAPKFSQFVFIMDTRLNHKGVVIPLEKLMSQLVKHEETLNKKLNATQKEPNVTLGATNTPFKKRFNNQ